MVLAAATLIQASVSLAQQAPAALGPALLVGLGIGHARLGLLTSALIGGMAATTLLAGVLIDRAGERRVVVCGVAGMALAVFAAGLSAGFALLFALCLLASFGAAASTPGGSKATAAWFPKSQRGFALSIRQTGVPLGGLAAAIILPPVVAVSNWRVGLFCAAAIVLLATITFAWLYRESPENPDGKNPSSKAAPAASAASGSVGAVGAGSVSGSISTLKSLAYNRSFVAATIFSFILVGGQWSATSFIAVFAHESVGLSIVSAGIFLGLLQAGGIAGRILLGLLSDRLGSRKPALILAGAGAACTCAAMSFMGNGAPLAALGVVSAALGFLLLGWNGIYIAYLSEATPPGSAATAVGAGLTVTNLGSLTVPPLFGLLVDLSGSYTLLWIALTLWVALGTVAAMAMRVE